MCHAMGPPMQKQMMAPISIATLAIIENVLSLSEKKKTNLETTKEIINPTIEPNKFASVPGAPRSTKIQADKGIIVVDIKKKFEIL